MRKKRIHPKPHVYNFHPKKNIQTQLSSGNFPRVFFPIFCLLKNLLHMVKHQAEWGGNSQPKRNMICPLLKLKKNPSHQLKGELDPIFFNCLDVSANSEVSATRPHVSGDPRADYLGSLGPKCQRVRKNHVQSESWFSERCACLSMRRHGKIQAVSY